MTSIPSSPTADGSHLTREAELSSALASVRATQTVLAQVPSQQPTDCGAGEWWNYAGGSAIDFMNSLADADSLLLTPVKATTVYDEISMNVSAYADVLKGIMNNVSRRDYSLCIKAGRDALLAAMDTYYTYMLERSFSLSEIEPLPTQYPRERVAKTLTSARDQMKIAASEIQRVTGADTNFLLEDGIKS